MADTPLVKIAPNNPIFDLPVLVGIEEGLFRKAGLDVRMAAPYEAREKDNTQPAIMSRLKESQFDCGSADSYNVCEWASIDRLERGTRSGNIGALRACIAAQAILTYDETLQVPGDLADIPVVVQEHTGSEQAGLMSRLTGWLNEPKDKPIAMQPARRENIAGRSPVMARSMR